jgi:uncharacterized membrane protein YraQ (UPF0718 family)
MAHNAHSPPATAWPALLRQSFGYSFWFFVLLAVLMGVACYRTLGAEEFFDAVASTRRQLGDLVPRVLAAQIAAGFIWVMVPRERMSAFLRRYTGKRGLIVATLGGIITPGGPASAFPFLAILAGAGADRGILVAYITSWALLGVQRIIVWDIPFMGMDFSLLRFLISLPLPIIAGLIARRLWLKYEPQTNQPGQPQP